jgi:mannose-6-phosphate isomerase
MQDLLKLKPIFQERIWGGTRLRDQFDYEIPSDQTGECWAISAHRNGDCTIENGVLQGKKLSEVYHNHRDLFNNCDHPTFPLLTKILDASNDLSVQVHPDDEYGLKHENDLGKTECWYIIDCDEGAEMIFGHHAKTKEELIVMIENNEWDAFLKRIKIKPGDFFYVPSGTLHALCKGTLVLETQQSSDTTYRVYDYDRTDDKGNKRDLHIKQAIDVTTVPHQDTNVLPQVIEEQGVQTTRFVSSKFFTVEKWLVNGQMHQAVNKFLLVSVLDGEGLINGDKIMKGDHFIVTSQCKDITIEGDLELIVSHL